MNMMYETPYLFIPPICWQSQQSKLTINANMLVLFSQNVYVHCVEKDSYLKTQFVHNLIFWLMPCTKDNCKKYIRKPLPVIKLDTSLNSCTDSNARIQMLVYFKDLRGKTHFYDFELERLLHMYWKITRYNDLTKKNFQFFLFNVFGMTNRYMVNMVFDTLEGRKMVNTCRKLSPIQFVNMLSIFCRGDLEERMNFAWKLYDSKKIGIILEERVFELLQHTLKDMGFVEGKLVYQPREYLLYILNAFDPHDERCVKYEYYKKVVLKQPGMLEAFGKIYPDQLAVHAFLTTFTTYISTTPVISRRGQDIITGVSPLIDKVRVPERKYRPFTDLHFDLMFADIFGEELSGDEHEVMEEKVVIEEEEPGKVEAAEEKVEGEEEEEGEGEEEGAPAEEEE